MMHEGSGAVVGWAPAQQNQLIIEINGLTKQYQSKNQITTVLHHVNLNIMQGELIAVTGSSGSGKSTLINIIGLLDTPTQGSYQLNQTHINSLNDDVLAQLRNQYFGFVFQQFNLLPRLSVYQNVALPLFYRDTSKEEVHERVMAALEKVSMAPYHARRPNQLSGGQQQRVAIARALIGDPQVILADEPTGALDSKTGGAILDLFLSLHAEGRTILLVTHDLALAQRCKRQIIMADGQIQSETL